MEKDNYEEKLEEYLEEDRKKEIEKEKEKQLILNKAASGNVKTNTEKVAFILNHYPETRNSDTELIWQYWHIFDDLKGNTISKDDYSLFAKPSTIIRSRAKLQNGFKIFQANNAVKQYRIGLEEDNKKEAIVDKPSYPLNTVYIDETGKTQEYLSVGSLWNSDPKSAFFSYSKLNEWKEKRKIDFEFHFAEVKSHRLENYKDFFLRFLTLNPRIGFKIMVIKRTGIKDIQNAITDLTFHLINSGVKHEHNSGRAVLPRTLQVSIDQEEEGSDMLKIENIKERLNSQQIEGLELDSFLAVDSKDNYFIQAVDLFTAAVNRKLHSTSKNNNPKDELADYILGLLKFKIDNIDKQNEEIDKSTLFSLSYNNEN